MLNTWTGYDQEMMAAGYYGLTDTHTIVSAIYCTQLALLL